MFQGGLGAGPGHTQREREGKCNALLGESPFPPPKRTHDLAFLVTLKRLTALSLSWSHCGAQGRDRSSDFTARSLQTCPCARPAWQVHIPGQVLAGPSELSGGAAEAAEAAPEAQGFHLRAAARRVPAPTMRSAPRQCHLQTLTPDECLKITMLPCLPLSFLCTYVGSQWDAAPTLSPDAHWPGARQGAGSGSHRCLLWGAGWLGCQLC